MRPRYLQRVQIWEGLEAFDELGKGEVVPHSQHRHEPSEDTNQAPNQRQRRARKYLVMVARDMSARRASIMVLRFLERIGPEPQSGGGSRHSTRSHTHGSSRTRIALHVMLSGSRNRNRF